MSAHQATRPFVARTVRLLAIPIIIFWAAFAITTNTFVPKVEDVAAELAGPLVPTYAPSQYALLHIGDKFKESNSTSLTMVVLEADRPLEDQDHQYYDELVRRLKQDTRCNRRGLSSDSEANVCILDGPYKGDSIAKALRKRLWAEHLGVEATDVDDPVKSAKLWQDKRNTSRVREYDPAKAKDPRVQTRTWKPPAMAFTTRIWMRYLPAVLTAATSRCTSRERSRGNARKLRPCPRVLAHFWVSCFR